MGGCGDALEGRRLVCGTCWQQLPLRLRRAVTTWRRSADPNVRSSTVIEVEAACVEARRRAR